MSTRGARRSHISPAAQRFVAPRKPRSKPTTAWGDYRSHLSPIARGFVHPPKPVGAKPVVHPPKPVGAKPVVHPPKPVGAKPAPLHTWTPFKQPTSPPTGSYDPGLDAQLGAAQRGYGDLQLDTATQGQRATNDYNLSLGNLNTQRGQLWQDFGLGRTVAATQRANNEQDYQTAGTALNRRYNVLAGNQNQAARASGQGLGGVLAASAAKRAEHQGLDTTALNTSHSRTVAAEDLADKNAITSFQRGNQGLDTRSGALGVDFLRGGEDRATQLARAGRENTQFGLDIGKQEYYQAQQAGTELPHAPAGEYVGSTGKAYRGIKGDAMHVLLPSGHRVPRATVDPHGAARVLAARKAKAQQAGTELPHAPAGEYVGSTGKAYRGIKGDAMHVLLPSGRRVPRATVDPHGAARVLAARKARARRKR